MKKSSTALALTLIALLSAAACKGSDDARMSANNGRVLGRSNANMSIRTTDRTMKLGIANDTVYMGLTDSVLAAATEDMARDTEEKQNAFGATIERFVKKSVSSALHTRLTYPVADLDSVSYVNGTIRFAYRNKRKIGFEDVSQDGHKAMQSFDSADAERFVQTVNSAIQTVRGR